MGRFKEVKPFEERRKMFLTIMNKCENKIPIIIETDKRASLNFFSLAISIKPTRSVYKIIQTTRKKIAIPENEALYFYCNKKLLMGKRVIGEIYEQHKDEDGFLYITVTSLESMGCY